MLPPAPAHAPMPSSRCLPGALLAAVLLPVLARDAWAQPQSTYVYAFSAELGATGQTLSAFDGYVDSYNARFDDRLTTRLGGANRTVGGYLAGHIAAGSPRVAVALDMGVGFHGASLGEARFEDGFRREIGLRVRDGWFGLGAGQMQGLRVVGEIGVRAASVRSEQFDADDVSDEASPFLCRRRQATGCYSGTWKEDTYVARAGLALALPRTRAGGGPRVGLHVAALVPVWTKSAELYGDGLRFDYLDYGAANPIDRCIFTTTPDGCRKYFPNDVSQPENADGNRVSGALRGLVLRAGLTFGIATR